jgi:hypothetical protein
MGGNTVMVMPANNSSSEVHYWAGVYAGLIGHLYSPSDTRRYAWLPFALDNGAFPAFTHGRPFDDEAFCAHLHRYAPLGPRWVVVPDVVGSRDDTLRSWDRWYPECAASGVPLAMAVQDGMTEADVPSEAAVIFIGGTTAWKRRTMAQWCAQFSRVHVGRINTNKWLWRCVEIGAESCDGTGWFRGDAEQLDGLRTFLREYVSGERKPPTARVQPSLFEVAYA